LKNCLKHKMVTSYEKKEIRRLLKTSTITEHNKEMIRILLDVMGGEEVDLIFHALKDEERKMKKLDKKEEIAVLKYKMSVDRLANIHAKSRK